MEAIVESLQMTDHGKTDTEIGAVAEGVEIVAVVVDGVEMIDIVGLG